MSIIDEPDVYDNAHSTPSLGPGSTLSRPRQLQEKVIASPTPSALGVTPASLREPAARIVVEQLLPSSPRRPPPPPGQHVVVVLPAPSPAGGLDHDTAARLLDEGTMPMKTTLLCAAEYTDARPLLEWAGVFKQDLRLDRTSSPCRARSSHPKSVMNSDTECYLASGGALFRRSPDEADLVDDRVACGRDLHRARTSGHADSTLGVSVSANQRLRTDASPAAMPAADGCAT